MNGKTGSLQDGAVRLEAVTKAFGTYVAVNDITLDVGENEFFSLLGPSGCGKTTLLRMLAGFEYPTRGAVKIAGTDVTDLPPNKRPVNTVFQSYALFPHMTVSENIGFALRMQGRPRDEIERTVDKMLAMIHLEGRGNQPVKTLSGGQQQRVALARALAPQPRVLLLDEPLSALDLKLRKAMQIELKRIQAETGITFIFVTHDQEEAMTMSDRIAVMKDGRILQLGRPREIYERPVNRFVADFIGETNVVRGEILSVSGEEASFRLQSGVVLTARSRLQAASGEVTAVVRPEHAWVTSDLARAHLKGTVRDIVYLGTDSQIHITTEHGLPFVVRLQNRSAEEAALSLGSVIGIEWNTTALQIVGD